MALYPNIPGGMQYEGTVGKSHTNLVVSEGNAPAVTFVVSKDNKFEPFLYEFGPEGNQTVVLPKGKIVEASGSEYDREKGAHFTALKMATEESERVLGVNHHNVYETVRGAMTGSGPTVITRNLVEVPLFEHEDVAQAEGLAAAMKFGAAYGTTESLQPGDYVVVGSNGNFKKYDKETHTSEMIVGQVWSAIRDLPPMGFLQYYMDIDSKEWEEYMKAISNPASPGANGYPYGAPYSVKGWKPEFLKQLGAIKPGGIPFLTDGFFRAQKRIDVTLKADDANVEAVRLNEVTTYDSALDTLTVAEDEKTEGFVYVKLAHKVNPRKMENVEVSFKDAEDVVHKVSARDIKVLPNDNTVAVYFDNGAYKEVTISVDAIVNPVAGLPTEWDYQGSAGAVQILLQK